MFKKSQEDIVKFWKGDISKPKVSICCITFMHEKYISQALDSFLMQETNFPFEIIVRDDCSSDKTPKIIKEYEEKYPNIIKPIFESENMYSKGVRPTPETLKKAVGEYIALCEGDDYWLDKDKLQKQIDYMSKYKDINISFHPCYVVNGNNLTNTILSEHSDKVRVFSPNEVINGSGSFCPTASLVIKKNAVSCSLKWIKEAPVGDYFLQIIASNPNGALYINEPMSIYRQNINGSWTTELNKNLNKEEVFFKNMVIYLKKLDEYLEFKFHKEIYGMIIHRYQTMIRKYILIKNYNKFNELFDEMILLDSFVFGIEYKLYNKLRKIPYFIYLLQKNDYILKFLKKIKTIKENRG